MAWGMRFLDPEREIARAFYRRHGWPYLAVECFSSDHR